LQRGFFTSPGLFDAFARLRCNHHHGNCPQIVMANVLFFFLSSVDFLPGCHGDCKELCLGHSRRTASVVVWSLVVPVSYSDSRVSSNGFRLRKPNSLGFP
jgi:hypothetical protein